MTVTATTQHANVLVPETSTPNRPPKPELDDLNGYLDVYLAQSVKPHRDRLADILSVIDGTPTGRAVLDCFRDRASQNHALVVNLLPAGAPLPDGAAAQNLWLNEADLTAHAEQIGVPPEVQYAPSVFQAMVLARNALLAQQCGDLGNRYSEQVMQTPSDLQACFQKELAAYRNKAPVSLTSPVPLDRAQTLQMVQAQAITNAMAELNVNRDLRRIPVEPKPGGTVPADQSPAPLPGQRNGRSPSDATATVVEKQPMVRTGSLGSSRALEGVANSDKAALPGVVVPSVPSSSAAPQVGQISDIPVDPTTDPNAGQPAQEPVSTPKQKKPRRRVVTQWIGKRFQALTDGVDRWRRAVTSSRTHQVVSQTSVTRSDSTDSATSKTSAKAAASSST